MRKTEGALVPAATVRPERIPEEDIQRLEEIIRSGKTVGMACGIVRIVERKLYAQMHWDEELRDRIEMAKNGGLAVLHDAFAEAALKDAKAQLTYMRIFAPESMNPDPRGGREVHVRVEHVKKELPAERIDAEGRVIDVSFDFQQGDEDDL